MSDQHASLARDPRHERSNVLARGELDNRITERGHWCESLGQRGKGGQVALVRDDDKAAALRFGGDHPAVDQLFVERELRRHDADDLRRIGRNQLFAKRVRAKDQILARRHAFDRAAAGNPRHRHAIAARKQPRAPFLQAVDRFAALEQNLEMPAVRGDDQARLALWRAQA